MKKTILSCVFGSIAIGIVLLNFIGCKGQANPENNKPKVYKIGDEGPGGGIVFYFDEKGFTVYDGEGGEEVCHYLEMSKNYIGKLEEKEDEGCGWFPEFSEIKTQEGIGYGKSNTRSILRTKASKELTGANCAALRCSKYATKTAQEGEWWLPSKDELKLIFDNQKKLVRKTSPDSVPWYWSSTAKDNIYVWCHNFSDGSQSDWNKDYENNAVRAIRAF